MPEAAGSWEEAEVTKGGSLVYWSLTFSLTKPVIARSIPIYLSVCVGIRSGKFYFPATHKKS